ncbi:MAG: DUF4062 domain-containing protein, partial [Promethearchaeota archaeon]
MEERIPKSRHIRVFVSSTFKDMVAEREVLAKRVFPLLRKMCEGRNVTFTDVDLRWGITNEEKAEGKVLPICIDEIDRCRPYFVGILGERYGWVPGEVPGGLLEIHPWLSMFKAESVTALEIRHGVLNNPAMAKRSFFYFRDPAYINEIPEARRKDFIGTNKEKLNQLKAAIRESGLSVVENYANPAEFAEHVLADLQAAIDDEFPPTSEYDPLREEIEGHELYARSRFETYIARDDYFERLDMYIQNRTKDLPLLVTGQSGSGKSALLANWIDRYRLHGGAGVHCIQHFAGATPASAGLVSMLRRFIAEINRVFDLDIDIPSDIESLRSSFVSALWQVHSRDGPRLVLVIDAVNQLDRAGGAHELTWIPPKLPATVSMIISSLPGRPLDVARGRGFPELQVEPLTCTERETLTREYLQRYRKSLPPDLAVIITSAPQTANPLYLRTLLEELRLHGGHDTLGQRIDYYLEATTPDELFTRVLARYESDYGRERPGLVSDAFSLLWAARQGLSETELLAMLGRGRDDPLPTIHWSPLFIAARHVLVDKGGLLSFSHDYFRQAVKQRYLDVSGDEVKVHQRIAGYFSTMPVSRRRVAEQPWQLAKAGDFDALVTLLVDPDFLLALDRYFADDVLRYWARIEAKIPGGMVVAYRPVSDSPADSPGELVFFVALLFQKMGYLVESLDLYKALSVVYSGDGDFTSLQRSLGNQAYILSLQGDLDGAMKLHEEEERICRELGLKEGLQASLGNQANILYLQGDLDGAMAFYKEQESICRELDFIGGVQASLGNQAIVLSSQGDLDGAMTLHEEEERICRELGFTEGIQATLGNQAQILFLRGDLDGAMKLLKEKERICRELGLKRWLQESLGNQAIILSLQGDLDGAMALLKEQESICRELGLKDGLQASFGNQANILYLQGDLDGAMVLYKEEEQICRELGLKEDLQVSFGGQANIFRTRGDLDGAMALLEEQESICRELGLKKWLQESLGNQAIILSLQDDSDGALALLKEQESICRELGLKDGLQASLGNQARILSSRGDLDGAMKLLEAQESICRELGLKEGLQASLGNQANILYLQGDLDGVMALLEEQESICREVGLKESLQVSLGNQARILSLQGDLDGAVKLYGEQVRICRELGLKDGLQAS